MKKENEDLKASVTTLSIMLKESEEALKGRAANPSRRRSWPS
jgi:hypothetical protein